jgi:GNAT superfamily N-acetyltransferase
MDEIAVRLGTSEDFNEMMRLSIAATEENAFVAPDVELLANQVWAALTMQKGVVGVIGKEIGGKLEGAILLNIGPVWYSSEPVLEEKAIFVDPEYRAAKGGRARKLADFAKKMAEELELPLAIGVLSNSRTEAKIRLYERTFGKPAGVYFLYNAKTGIVPEIEGET